MTDLGSFRSGSEPYSSLITRSAVTIEAIGSPVDFSATDHLPWDCGETTAGSTPPAPGRPSARARHSITADSDHPAATADILSWTALDPQPPGPMTRPRILPLEEATMSLLDLPYPSRRAPMVAHRGIVATSQPLAALAGLEVLKDGGNAVDAAIATAAMLTVVEPTSNGIGSDAFALVWDGTRLHGLNGSGRAPAGLTIDRVQAAGHTTMPNRGWLPVTVPGAPRAWRDLHDRFGRLPFEALFEPAITYARDGYPVGP